MKDREAGYSNNHPPTKRSQSDALPARKPMSHRCGRADINDTPSDLEGKRGQDERSAMLPGRGDQSRKCRSRSRQGRRYRDPYALTADSLAAWNCAQLHRPSRVKAYTPGGKQCCIAGFQDLAFPGPTSVRSVLASNIQWIQRATPEEKAATGKWYTFLPFKPKTVVFSNGSVAFPHECLGDYGNTVTVLAQEHKLCQHQEFARNQGGSDDVIEDEREQFLAGVPTPRTPSSCSVQTDGKPCAEVLFDGF